MKLLLSLLMLFTFLSQGHCADKQKAKVVYKYKKYEKFDFDKLDVSSEKSSPGDISVVNRFQRKFNNRLPNKRNFKSETMSSLLKY